MSERKNKKRKKSADLSRRDFLATTGTAAAAFTIVPRHVLGGPGYQAPSDMVNVAGIGVGARGAQDIAGFADPDVPIERPQRSATGQPLSPEEIAEMEARRAEWARRRAEMQQRRGEQQQQPQPQEEEEPRKLANIYALCDVDTGFAGHVFKGYPKAKVYQDFRKMLDNESEIDAVMIGTPDHTHAVIAAYAMRMGKHVYVEKPLCKTVYECRRLAEIAKETNVVTQMGNQGHATEGSRQTAEWIQSGAIGPVREVNLSTNRPIWPQGDIPRPEAVPVPDGLDWDVWLGPAPEKPYHPDICHFNWRGLWDYGTGAMGDMGAHILDAAVWALKLGLPTKIQASSSRYNEEFLPLAEMLTYEFAARGDMPPVKLTWVDGGLRSPRPADLEPGRPVEDAIYLGDTGTIMHRSHGAEPHLVPDTAMEAYEPPEPWIPRTGDIYEDFIDAIKNGRKSSNDFSVASHLTEIMLLGNIAVLTANRNTILDYDGANGQFTNLPEANDLLHYEYRTGWTL
jgi:predicted dehydrogenase